MSTPLELQRQLRQTTEEYYEQMQRLNRDLALQLREETEQKQGMDFRRLSARAQGRPLVNRSLQMAEGDIWHDYLALLCLVARSAPEMEDGWLFIQRIACGIGIYSLADSAETAACLKEEDLERIARQFPNCGLRDAFLLDAMLVRLACSKPCPDTTALLAQLCNLMDCAEADIRFLSRLAVILANQDGKAYLALGLELGERNWLGLEYIQKSAGILYTDQIAQAAKHGFHRVILHDCTASPEDFCGDTIKMSECCLFRCHLKIEQYFSATDTTIEQCNLQMIYSLILEISDTMLSIFQITGKSVKHEYLVTMNRVRHRDCSIEFINRTQNSHELNLLETPKEGLKLTYTSSN